MLDRIVKFLTSLRLTVVLLCLGVMLVFLGTVAQEPLGLYVAQQRFFRSFFVDASSIFAAFHKIADMILQGFGRSLPPLDAHDVLSVSPIRVFPGGYLLGTLLLANLLAAHASRFKLTKKKIGIFLVHLGVILLLVGQLLTDVFSTESTMRLSEGQSKNYSDSSSGSELAIVESINADTDQVVAIPEALLEKAAEIAPPQLPFTLRVKEYSPNSEPQILPAAAGGVPAQAEHGLADRFRFDARAITTKADDKNVPAIIVELLTRDGSLGTWLLACWATDEPMFVYLRRVWSGQLGKAMGERLAAQLTAPVAFEVNGRKFQIALRPVRFYKPFELNLLKFTHEQYRGTDTPKNFASRVRLERPDTGEDREVLIYMNNPLRYNGETYYQAGFDPIDPRVTTLQVVRNPGWLTPYFACGLVALGLVVQFLTHLIGFATKRRTA